MSKDQRVHFNCTGLLYCTLGVLSLGLSLPHSLMKLVYYSYDNEKAKKNEFRRGNIEHISAAHNGQFSILLKSNWNRRFSINTK